MLSVVTAVAKDPGQAERTEQHPESAVAGCYNPMASRERLYTHGFPSDAVSILQSDSNEFGSEAGTEDYTEEWFSEYKSLVPDATPVTKDKTTATKELFSRISGIITNVRRRRGASNLAPTSSPSYSLRRRLAPLHYAIRRGDTSEVKRLVELGFDINIKISRTKPLQFAIIHGDPEMIKVLVDLGADVNGIDQLGLSPLVTAIRHDDLETVRLLVDLGADTNAVNPKSRLTPLITAIHRDNLEMVKLLADLGADIHTPICYGWTPLIHAVSSGAVEVVRLIVDLGVDVKTSTTCGMTPLSLALKLNRIEKGDSERALRYRNILAILCIAQEPGTLKLHIVDTAREAIEQVNGDSFIEPRDQALPRL